MNITNESRTDFTRFTLLDRAADYFVEARKPRAEWKKLEDLAAQLAEFDLRCTAGDYAAAASVLTNIDYDYLLLWGHYRLIINLYESITEKIKDRIFHMWSCLVLGLAYKSIGDTRKSIYYFEQGVSAARDSNNRKAESVFIGNLGFAYSVLGEMYKAIDYYEHSLVIAKEIGDRRSESAAFRNLGLTYAALGDTHKAIELHEQALIISREIGDRMDEGNALGNLGLGLISLAEYKKSIEAFLQSIQIADGISNSVAQNKERWVLAQAYLFQNDLVNSRATIEAALQYDVPENNHNASALHGIIALRQGERETAQEAFMKSIAQADEILAKTPDYYSALDAKGLALCGRAVSREWRVENSKERDEIVAEAVKTFKQAREIAPHAGVVKSVLRLFDELVKCDEEEILKDVREAVEGKG